MGYKVGLSHLDSELLSMIESGGTGGGGGRLVTNFQYIEAKTDGQTDFNIELSSFNASNDTLFVVDGQGWLLPNIGYTVNGKTVTMTEPWKAGDGGGLFILKSANSGGGGGSDVTVNTKLVTIPMEIVAETDGQTEFTIELDSFDSENDTVFVLDGGRMLLQNSDYVVEGNKIILNEGWNAGDVGGLIVLKNVTISNGEDIPGVASKLESYKFAIEATEDGQNEFEIPLKTFDAKNDLVLVVDGQAMLFEGVSFNVVDNKIVLETPWNTGDRGGIIVLKNAPAGTGGTISGSAIADGSISEEKLDDELLSKLGNGGGSVKMEAHRIPIIAEVEGQTEFEIPLETFDADNDLVLVLDGQGMLFEGVGFNIEGRKIIMSYGWSVGDGGGIIVLKNVPVVADEKVIRGSMIADGSISEEKLDDELLSKLGNGGGRLETAYYPIEATEDGQTEFVIPLETFDASRDGLIVIDGKAVLSPNVGYTVAGRTVTMTQPWNTGDGGTFFVMRNAVEIPEIEETISGALIADSSITAEKLADGVAGGMTMDLLWENASPTSAFEAQTIALNLSAYSMVIVNFGFASDYSDISSQCVAIKNKSQRHLSTAGSGMNKRIVTPNDNGVVFSTGYTREVNVTTETPDSKSMIPLEIYGIK